MFTSYKKFTLILFSLSLLIIAAFVGFQRYYLFQKETKNKKDFEKFVEAQKIEKEKNLSLIYNKKSSAKKESVTIELPKTPKAKGTYSMDIVLVKPLELKTSEINGLTSNLKDSRNNIYEECVLSACTKNASLNYMNTFIKEEQLKYGKNDFNFDLKLYGPYSINNLTKVGDLFYIWGKSPFSVAKLQDSFEEIYKKNVINAKKDSFVVFLYFDNSNEEITENLYSFYETKKFRSFSVPTKKRAYVNIYDFSPSFSQEAVEIVLHEIIHFFGALDKYIEGGSTEICYDHGIGNAEQIPLYPQKTSDLFCPVIKIGPGKYVKGYLADKTIVINKYTARELGWID